MSPLLRLLWMMRGRGGWMLLGILLSLLTLLANVTLLAVSGWFIAAMALAGAAGVSMNYFSPAAVIRAMAILRTAGRYGERVVTHETTLRFIADLRGWLFRRLEPITPSPLDRFRSGDLLSRLIADVTRLEDFYLRLLLPLAVALVGGSLISWVAWGYHPLFGGILATLLFCAGVLLPLAIGRLSRQPARRVVEAASKLRTEVVDGLQGMAELEAHGASAGQRERIDASSRGWIDSQKRLAALDGLSQAGLLLFTQLAAWLSLWVAIGLLRKSMIDPPELVMLVLLSLAAFEAVMPLPMALRLFGSLHAAAGRLFEIVDLQPEVTEPDDPAPRPQAFDVVVEGVSFAWDEAEGPVIRELDLDLAAGKRLALLGPSGAGKSSLIPLLLGFHRPQQGCIRLGGRAIEQYRGEDLREWIAVAPQQPQLFNASLADNLRLARPQASDDELRTVCRIAQLEDFIERNPDGLDTWLGETGLRLSGGQARRVAVARALLRDPQLLILDEPGEGLDALTESRMIEAILEWLGERSLLLLTHSQTGLRHMDEILVLEQGRVIERGCHAELLQRGGWYAESLLLVE